MTSRTNIYAIAEMSRRIEKSTRDVRLELYRLGCSPAEIQVVRQGYFLQMKFQQQIILADPNSVLRVLQRIPEATDATAIWLRINENMKRSRQRNVSTQTILIAIAVGLLLVTAAAFAADLSAIKDWLSGLF